MKRSFLLISLALLLSQLPVSNAAAASKERCFSLENPAIVNCITGAVKSYWEANGGLSVFGYPISKVTTEKSSSGDIQVQWFERARMEQHPKSQPPYNVQLTLLGEMLLQSQGRDWRAGSPAKNTAGCQLFPETARTLCEPFLSYYRSHGLQFDKQPGTFSEAESLALFGLPLTEPAMERAANGQTYLTQWFQRARFELHPENPPATQVLLGLLGTEAHDRSTTPKASPAPQATSAQPGCGSIPAARNAIVPAACLSDGDRYRTPFSLKGYEPGELVSVWLVGADGIAIGTQGRATCLLNGNSVSLTSLARCHNWQLDDYGNASGVELNASDLYPGQWELVLQSTKRDTNSVVFFQVLPHPQPKNDPCAGTPASVKAIIIPACGQSGALVKIIGQGFDAGERVSFYITAPDTIVEPITTGYYMSAEADAQGNAVVVGRIPDSALNGDYFITIAGVASDHKAIAVFHKI